MPARLTGGVWLASLRAAAVDVLHGDDTGRNIHVSAETCAPTSLCYVVGMCVSFLSQLTHSCVGVCGVWCVVYVTVTPVIDMQRRCMGCGSGVAIFSTAQSAARHHTQVLQKLKRVSQLGKRFLASS